ncbi:MAG: 30S ribosomal protein S20 [Chlamydiae bacterium GWC2_50_10]|nr:MAG: 30S ribosomal protein S20 [Chlamydiae bacterium GWA2_50_15]OGN54341.1 MAG: 30S ribosomal protein S20 [Chlamydiae bacterium GWC2_50_10]OGN54848.1 MAG: 30S ribosomal protein S20 [Chlamydiae bacterium GWF2_49_8]OGN59010.1 MAG: 30S ribosomal protein S20 [Chlamydiae bacterium RIFCSPHIGHO2_02_FULL_49_29]OGN62829.1 MAG: 30S ribosomal protein S20 [Chlamydiae bacterium RIFCSPHIGHO2_12_FULL_49_32]OGN71686.1 MAG: 30S ribosomal protein S20 [Chlamydiae bacterium RIFCSPLOWO2_02_FULL_49_12]OGN75236.
MAEETPKTKTKRPTAKKRILQSKKCLLKNKSFKSQVKNAIRAVQDACTQNSPAAPSEKLSSLYRLVDKGMKKGIIKPNKASRIKSKLSRKLSAATQKAQAPSKYTERT